MIKKGAILIIFILLAVGGWMWYQNRESEPTILKIGVISPLTGSLSTFGVSIRNGAAMAVNDFNNAHDDFKIELIVRNNEGEKEKTEQIAKEFMDNPEILAIIGPLISSNTLTAGQMAQTEKIVLITPTATSPKISNLGNYVFRTCASDLEQGRDVANFMIEEGYGEVGVIYQEDETYSSDLAEVFMEEMQGKGIEAFPVLTYQKDASDFSQQIAEIEQEEPEIIFGPGYPSELTVFIQQLREKGLNDIQFIGGDGITNEDYIKFGGEAVEGTFGNTLFDSSNPDPLVQKAAKRYEDLYQTKIDWMAAHSYDALNILAEAILESKNKERSEIRDLVAQTKDYRGVSGEITFDENGDPAGKKYIKLQVQDGEWIFYK